MTIAETHSDTGPPVERLEPRHRVMLAFAFGMAGIALALTSLSVYTGREPIRAVPSPVDTSRQLHFLDRPGGVVAVYDARTKAQLAAFSPGEGAFVRTSIRALNRNRLLGETGLTSPFILRRLENGRIELADPETGKTIVVTAFGRNALDSLTPLLSTHLSQQGAEK